MPIITLSDAGLESDSWQWHMQNAVKDVAQLCEALNIKLPAIDTDFPLKVPWPYIQRMRQGDRSDPLLRQVLPISAENKTVPGFVHDPLEEMRFTGVSRGIVQKYQGRVLVIATGTCAINCRYCFRRHFPYEDHQSRKSDWSEMLEAIRADASISEVILSGGDPLVLGDARLEELTSALDEIPHVTTIRFHTRVPVVIPQRISEELLRWLSKLTSRVVFVLHINHANEIDEALCQSIAKLTKQGVTVLNQTVLLKDVNDSATALVELSRELFMAGVLPYYLHLLDPVAGAQHFDVVEKRGQQLLGEITSQLPGYLVPKLVREVPGENAKHGIPIG